MSEQMKDFDSRVASLKDFFDKMEKIHEDFSDYLDEITNEEKVENNG